MARHSQLFAAAFAVSGWTSAVVPLSALCMAMVFAGCVTPAREMTVMSFNVRHCVGSDMKLDVPRVAAAIAAVKPRFAALQELDVKTERSACIDEPAELARLTGMKATFGKTIDFQGGEYGVMVLSDEKPLSVTKVPLPGKEPRLLLLAEFDDCVFASTHLSVADETERMASVGLVRSAVSRFKKPVFVCGDWNARPDSPVLKELGKTVCVEGIEDKEMADYLRERFAVSYFQGYHYSRPLPIGAFMEWLGKQKKGDDEVLAKV